MLSLLYGNILTSVVVVVVVSQKYVTRVIDEDVLAGNSAIFKCMIPSFVADFVSVQSWVDSEATIFIPGRSYGNDDMGGGGGGRDKGEDWEGGEGIERWKEDQGKWMGGWDLVSRVIRLSWNIVC